MNSEDTLTFISGMAKAWSWMTIIQFIGVMQLNMASRITLRGKEKNKKHDHLYRTVYYTDIFMCILRYFNYYISVTTSGLLYYSNEPKLYKDERWLFKEAPYSFQYISVF